MSRIAIVLTGLLALLVIGPSKADQGKALKVEDLFRFKRLADPQISPDGKQVVYVVTTVDLDHNSTNADLWLIPTAGGEPKQLTTSPKHERHPRWSPDGKKILFESNRSGSSQLWVIDVNGGEARQLTTISSGASNGIWSPDGKQIAFVSAVYPEFSDKPFKESDAANKKKQDEAERNPVKARVMTRLFYRHWDEWVEDKRQHLFVIPAAGGEPRDVTPGDRDAYPTSTTFSVGDDFTFSPDSSHLVYTAPPVRDEAWSTNYELWRVPVSGGEAECLTTDNPAADDAPAFSSDGKQIAWRAQQRPGYEADRWEIVVADCDASGKLTGKPRKLALKQRGRGTAAFDLSVDAFIWQPESTAICFLAEQEGKTPVFRLDVKTEMCSQGPAPGTISSLHVSNDGQTIVGGISTLFAPPTVFTLKWETNAERPGSDSTNFRIMSLNNRELLRQFELPRAESVKVSGSGGTPMQMWILKPPGFDPSKKWPLVYLVHGGPQGAWSDGWSNRWNPQVWAAQGYVVALPNPRGSTGFGQKYVDEISGDWGGKCYEDLMAGVDYLEKLPWIDKDRMASAGASFGGYMMNWFQGKTTRFKTLITHCGVYNFDSMYATTDELWFDEWEHGGPPWGKNRASYEKHSPHRYAKNFKTPMLVIHNDLDFRVPVSEGHQLFTTLQRLGIPSRFVNFPDEGHWVLKPANSRYWHQEVFGWLTKYVPPGGK